MEKRVCFRGGVCVCVRVSVSASFNSPFAEIMYVLVSSFVCVCVPYLAQVDTKCVLLPGIHYSLLRNVLELTKN